jgi:glycosyltransferase involved in cell wall biosynthesis
MEIKALYPNNVPDISLIVPVFNEAEVIDLFFSRVIPVLTVLAIDYEIICVNDGSTDETLPKLIAHNQRNPYIKIIDLSRNFGKEAALTAGIESSSGKAIIPLDADLQDPPELLPEMIDKWREGYEVVIGIRKDRRSDSFFKRETAKLFYKLIDKMGEIPIPMNAGDFRLLDRKVVNALLQLPEKARFMKGIFAWLGFSQAFVYYSRPSRKAGQTKFKPWKLWNFALDGIISFSSIPLKVWTYLGILVSISSLCYMMFIIMRTIIHGIDVPGYASLMVAILFFSGLNMIGLGILGEYVSRIFIEVKQRPLYLVRKMIGFDKLSD